MNSNYCWNVKEMGASGTGNTNDTQIIQKAIDECSLSGGVVYFPPGTYSSGTLFIKSNVTLHLEKCAVLQAIDCYELFPMIEHNIPCTMGNKWKAFLYSYHSENITITGGGTISPRGELDIFQNGIGDSPDRPYGIYFVKCFNVDLNNIRLHNSAFWMQRFFQCEDLRLNKLHVYNHANINNDGLDVDGCKRVFISDCSIDASDDALCFKSHGEQACEDVVVSNCILSSHATAIKFGTGSVAGFKRFNINNCIIKPSIAPKVEHPMNLKEGLGGIDIMTVDGGVVEDINISNITISGVETPLFIKIGKRNRRTKEMTVPIINKIKNIRLSNISAQNVGPIACSITGYPGANIENIKLNDINMEVNRISHKDMPPTFDLCQDDHLVIDKNNPIFLDFSIKEEVPENETDYPCSRIFGTILPAYAFFIRHVENIVLENIYVSTKQEDGRQPLVINDVHQYRLDNCYFKSSGNHFEKMENVSF